MVVFIGASGGIAKPEQHRSKVLVVASVAFLLASVMLVPLSPLKDMSLKLDGTNSLTTVIVSLLSITLNALCLLVVFGEIGTTVGVGFQKAAGTQGVLNQYIGQHDRRTGLRPFILPQRPPWVWLLVTIRAAELT